MNKVTGISPTFVGPVFVHTEKSYEAYYYFFSTIYKLEPSLSTLRAIGTDGEQTLVKAATAVFPNDLIHLRCFIHMKDNIHRKLTDMLIPQSSREMVIKDIFGTQQSTVYTKGLLDATDTFNFDRKLSVLESKWNKMEMSVHPHRSPYFYDWLVRNEVEVMKTSMIASVRQDAGLGYPPTQYPTNRNKSINRVVQQYCNTDCTYSTWIQLSNKLYDLIINQQKEVEKAINGMGEYKFKDPYRHLEIESAWWFKMTPDQRRNAIQKVLKEKCILYESQNDQPSTSTVSQSGPSHLCLSVQPDKSGITTLSADFILSLWRKAEKILNMPNGICEAPGMTGAKCVASETGGKPHIVIESKRRQGLLNCDDTCLGWKSQRICSHVLAAAESMGCLEEFLQHYKGNKTCPNFTAAVTHGIPKGAGKKPGGKAKRKGPASLHRPEIETVIDPFVIHEPPEIDTPASTPETRSSVESMSS